VDGIKGEQTASGLSAPPPFGEAAHLRGKKGEKVSRRLPKPATVRPLTKVEEHRERVEKISGVQVFLRVGKQLSSVDQYFKRGLFRKKRKRKKFAQKGLRSKSLHCWGSAASGS